MNGWLKLLCAGVLVCIPVSGAGQQPIEQRVPESLSESQAVVDLRLRLRVIRRNFESIGPNHPQYKATKEKLTELEGKLREIIGDPIDATKEKFEGKSGSSIEQANARPLMATSTRSQRSVASINRMQRNKPSIEKKVVKGSDLKLIGGWVLPSKGAGGKGLGFSRGGLFVERPQSEVETASIEQATTDRLIYLYGHRQAKEAHVLKVSLDNLGTDPAKRQKWPEAKPVKLLRDSHSIRSNKPYSICRPSPDGPLLTTGRVFYATEPYHWTGPWMNWYDSQDGTTVPMAVENHVDRRQVFGGGFCDVPRWFADAHLQGRDFGIGFGGYRSGQESSPGPSFFVADRPKSFSRMLTNCRELLSFRWEGKKHERERRPADYTTPLFGPAAERGTDETATGWWQADEVIAGPVWIDTPEKTGLCYWSIQGLGDLDYKLQSVAFSEKRRVRLYVYDPADFISVIRGGLQPWQVRGTYHEWSIPFDKTENADRWPIGAYWDNRDQLLYLAYRNSGLGEFEIAPAVAIYKIH